MTVETPPTMPETTRANPVLTLTQPGGLGTAKLNGSTASSGTTIEAKPPAATGYAPNQNPNWMNPVRPWRVAAVVPCFNRPQDVELLLRDLARLQLDFKGRPLIELWVILVDNASTVPLSGIRPPPGVRLEHLRNSCNAGGAGGFNLGMSQVLSGKGLTGECGKPDFIWWLDSDARVSRRCLRELVRALVRSPHLGAVGSALCDPTTGQMWELGGHVIRGTGQIRQSQMGDVDRRLLTGADYLAACSALVRREAIEATGLLPTNFIYFDDVEWCIQCRAKTGLKVRGVPRSIAYHPPANRRFMTWGRYYIARNTFSHMNVMGMGGFKRFRRAMLEVPRAAAQMLMGLDELAELHIRGLNDALADFHKDIEPKDLLKPLGNLPYRDLRETVRAEMTAQSDSGGGDSRHGSLYVHPIIRQPMPGFEQLRAQVPDLFMEHGANWPRDWKKWRKRSLQTLFVRDLCGAIWRAIMGPTADVAIVPTGWPSCWFRGKTLIQITTDGFITRRVTRRATLANAAKVCWKGILLSIRLGLHKPKTNELPKAPAWNPSAKAAQSLAHAAS
jgi:GT2 family glycosyltransferase